MNIKDRLKLLIRKSDVVTPLPDIKYQVWGNVNIVDQHIDIPSIIWLYWHDDVISSPITNICIHRIIELNPTYEVRIVHWKTIHDYLPEFPVLDLSKVEIAQVSDLVRLMLLEQYGGVYLDASTYLTESIDWIIHLSKKNQTEFVGYYTQLNTRNENYPTIENWFLASRPKCAFIKAWLIEYSAAILSSDPNRYYENQHELSIEESVMGYTYYKAYFAIQLVIRRSQDYKLTLVEADSDAFLYSIRSNTPWSDILTAQILLINRAPDTYPKMIKLINTARKTIDKWITKKYYKKDSLLGKLLDDN